MRWVAVGIALAGVAVVAEALVHGGPHVQLVLGWVAFGAGAAVLVLDTFFARFVERLGLRTRHVATLQRALQAGQLRGLASVERLRASGLDGRARILSVSDTGGSFNARSEVDLELEIEVDGRAPYRVRQRHLVPGPSMERLKQGEVLRVKIDPDASERLLIDWRK